MRSAVPTTDTKNPSLIKPLDKPKVSFLSSRRLEDNLRRNRTALRVLKYVRDIMPVADPTMVLSIVHPHSSVALNLIASHKMARLK